MDNKNTIIAIVLSAIVLIGWQYFVGGPQVEKQRQEALLKQQQQQQQVPAPTTTPAPGSAPAPGTVAQPGAPPAPGQATPAAQVQTREAVLAASPRITIDTPRLKGSIALKGARIDDLALVQYRETVDPKSPPIILYSPSGTAEPYYAEFGWVAGTGGTKVPDRTTDWQQEGTNSLTPSTPVMLKYDNGEGLTFRRTITIDDHYLFSIKDEVTNVGNAPAKLYPFALISRHGTPQVSGYYILHEGLIGYLGEQGLQEKAYKAVGEAPAIGNGGHGFEFNNVTNAWLGITDKYWASALLPDTSATLKARFVAEPGTQIRYQTDYLQSEQTVPIGGTTTTNARLFAGAKEAGVVGINFPLAGHGGYNKELG